MFAVAKSPISADLQSLVTAKTMASFALHALVEPADLTRAHAALSPSLLPCGAGSL